MSHARAKPRKFIAIAGNIGAGKTTLVDFLCQTYGFRPFVEPNLLNPYLDDFYGDMKRWSFHSQISFLSHKFRLHMELMAEPQTVVQDRTIYEDAEIFARHLHNLGYIDNRDFRTYNDLYQAMQEALAPPDLLIRLTCSVRSIRKRIRKRGRQNEQEISSSYLKQLNVLYDRWFDTYDLSPVVEINTEKLDYISDFVDRLEVQRAMEPFIL
ncbi:MAG: deoxynucleoside kinase [Rickettsiales bacterium]|nr:deoxynucleoside kinase [Rickettsiales bacterium]